MTSLTACARVPLANPAGMLEKLCVHFKSHATLVRTKDGAWLESRLGRFELKVERAALHLSVTGAGEGLLSVLKMAVAEPLVALAGEEAPRFAWSGHDAGRRDIPYFREMTVAGAHQVTPRMRRVILAGDAAHFPDGGLHVRLLIPPMRRVPVWPHAGLDGRTLWPAGNDTLTLRVYTVRHLDLARGELAIDVVLHEGAAPGSDWARNARLGDKVGLLGPGGGMPEAAASWYLLAGDETAVPAIARILASLPQDARAIVRIEVAGAAEEQSLPSPAQLDLQWLHRGDTPAGTSDLLHRAVKAVDLPKDLEGAYAWAGCEQASARALRAYLTKERAFPRNRQLVAAYWRLGHPGVDVAA